MATSATEKRDEHSRGNDDAKQGHAFVVIVNNQEFTTTVHELSGVEIKALAVIPGDYELFVVHGGSSVPVANTELMHIHERIEFRAIPAGTFGGSSSAAATTL